MLHDHAIGSAVTTLALHRESDLAAFAADDLAVRVIDLDTGKIVRVFSGHENRITDVVRAHTRACRKGWAAKGPWKKGRGHGERRTMDGRTAHDGRAKGA